MLHDLPLKINFIELGRDPAWYAAYNERRGRRHMVRAPSFVENAEVLVPATLPAHSGLTYCYADIPQLLWVAVPPPREVGRAICEECMDYYRRRQNRGIQYPSQVLDVPWVGRLNIEQELQAWAKAARLFVRERGRTGEAPETGSPLAQRSFT